MLNLSKNQQRAIEINDKHLRIIACAGSGKTTTVAHKVAKLLEPETDLGIKPENLIAFTYTERAAAELSHKILKEVGSLRGMADMYIGTIHGWCLKAIQEYTYGYQNHTVLDEIKLKLFVDKNYDWIGMKDITKLANPNVPLKRFVETSLFTRIMDIVRESELRQDASLPAKIKEAKKKYETLLDNKRYFDFSMIMEKAYNCLSSDENLISEIRKKLKYLIVDEYQDINPLQYKLITKLHEISQCRIIVVGDDDQNIYQWRGSSNKYIINFHKKFPESEVESVQLNVNYRSSRGITKLAETLIKNNHDRIPDKKMDSDDQQIYERGKDLIFNEYESVQKENEGIVSYIKNIVGVEFSDKEEQKRGIAYSDIAILLRTWKKAEEIVEELDKNNIPYITAGVNQLFNMPEVQASLGIFQLLYGEIEESELKYMWLNLPNNSLEPHNLEKAIFSLKEKNPKLPNNYRDWEYSLQGILWDFIETGKIFEENFINKSDEGLLRNSRERAEIMFYNIGQFSQVINDFEEINFNSSNPSFHLFSFLSFIKHAARDYYPEGWISNPYKTPDAVQIMTIHQSKGLEFPVVLIPGLNRNYLPAKKKGGLNVWHFLDSSLIQDQSRYERDGDNNEDERRLLYVAITRSQKYLFITRAPDLKNRLYRKPSTFVNELRKANLLVQDFRLEKSFEQMIRVPSKSKDKVRNITLDFTTLKDVFNCPYRFKLVSMYGFRVPLNQRMGLGKSFHNSLMELHKRSLAGEKVTLQDLKEIVARQTFFPYLKSQKLSESMPRIVENNVEEYFEDNKDSFDEIEFVEQEIQYKLSDDILVLGRVDLIKRRKESGNFETTIVEFKSKDDLQTSRITKDQLKLYALGHRELTGEAADYIMTYYIGEKDPERRAKVPEKLHEEDLIEIEKKIEYAADIIRNGPLNKVESKGACETCYQNTYS